MGPVPYGRPRTDHTPFEYSMQRYVSFPEVPSGAREAALRRCVGRGPELIAQSLAMNLVGRHESKTVPWPSMQPEHGEDLDLRCPPKIMAGEKLFHEVARPAKMEQRFGDEEDRLFDQRRLRRWLYDFASKVWQGEEFEGASPEEFLAALTQAVTDRPGMEYDAARLARPVFLSTSFRSFRIENAEKRFGREAEAQLLSDFVSYGVDRIFGPEIFQQILDRVSSLAWISVDRRRFMREMA